MEIVCEKYHFHFSGVIKEFFKVTTVVMFGLFISVKNLLLSHFYEMRKASALALALALALKVLSSNTSLHPSLYIAKFCQLLCRPMPKARHRTKSLLRK